MAKVSNDERGELQAQCLAKNPRVMPHVCAHTVFPDWPPPTAHAQHTPQGQLKPRHSDD